jgi:hypothetical protein
VTVIAQNISLLSNFTMHSAASLARQPCTAALPGSFARQFDQFRPDLNFDALARSAVTSLYYSGRSPNCMRALLS